MTTHLDKEWKAVVGNPSRSMLLWSRGLQAFSLFFYQDVLEPATRMDPATELSMEEKISCWDGLLLEATQKSGESTLPLAIGAAAWFWFVAVGPFLEDKWWAKKRSEWSDFLVRGVWCSCKCRQEVEDLQGLSVSPTVH